MVSVSDAKRFLKRVYTDFSEKNVTFMAAGLAYNAFVSLAPILFLLFLTLTLVGGREFEERVLETANTWLPGPIADVVRQLFESSPSAGGASILGLVVLLWGALKIFRGLDTAFSEIYETGDTNSFVDKLRDGAVVFVALVVAVLAMVGSSAAFALFSDVVPYIGFLTPFVLVVGLVIAFVPIYYVFPDTDLELRDVLPGAAFAAVGWAVFQALFQVYLSVRDPTAGGVFGGVLIVVAYLYFSALVLLIGAVINAAVGDHSSGRPGGVGRGAQSRVTRRERTLDRTELDAYLRALDERLTTTYDVSVPDGDDDLIPRPDGDVQLVEYTSTDNGDGDGKQRWNVQLSWTPDEESTDRPGGSPSATDD